jgi:FkbM family methyltransferase|tara:strand:+ start:20653 stop:21378 length:726 start_codon:yes stop_codon:yes gene_type:complete
MIQKIVLFIMSIFDFFYQKKILSFLKKNNLNNINILLDIGAHRGESINLFLNNMKVKKIISFEASPINFEFLKKKQKIYAKKFSDTEIIIENIALGSENKMMEFKHFNESSSSTIKNINEESKYFKRKFNLLNLFNKGRIYQTFQIKIQSLKEYIENNNMTTIDFLKIDTEGYEYEILLGLEDMIKLVKVIMFEHHYDNMLKKNYTFTNINDLLVKNNFKKIYKSRMPFRKTFEYIYLKSE